MIFGLHKERDAYILAKLSLRVKVVYIVDHQLVTESWLTILGFTESYFTYYDGNFKN